PEAWLNERLDGGLNPLHAITLGSHCAGHPDFETLPEAAGLARWIKTAAYLLDIKRPWAVMSKPLLQQATAQGQTLLHLCVGEVTCELMYYWIGEGAPCYQVNRATQTAVDTAEAYWSRIKHK